MTGVATQDSFLRADGRSSVVRSRSLNDLAEVYQEYSNSSTLFFKERMDKQAGSTLHDVLKRDPFHQHVGVT